MPVRALAIAAACIGCAPAAAYYPAVAGMAASQSYPRQSPEQMRADALEQQRLREEVIRLQGEARARDLQDSIDQSRRTMEADEARRRMAAAHADPPEPQPQPYDPTLVVAAAVTPEPPPSAQAPASTPPPRKPRRKAVPKPPPAATAAMSKAEQEAYDAETARRAAAAAKAKAEVAAEPPVKPASDECGESPEISGWDGLPMGLKSAFRSYARENYGDPDIEIVSCTDVSRTPPPKCWMTMCKVRGKNAFGAKVLNIKVFGKSPRGWRIYGD